VRGNLRGRTVLVTRAEEDFEAWARTIEEHGARAVSYPCIRCEPIRSETVASRLREALEGAAWVAVTSRRGAQVTGELLGGALPPGVRVAAVGGATAEAARENLGRCDLVAREGTGAALARDLARELKDGDPVRPPRVVAASAERAHRHLEQVLGPQGVEVIRVAVYRTLPARPREPREDLSSLGLDAILLASPSAARGLVNLAIVPAEVPVYSIGPTTTHAARSLGLDVAAEAGRPEIGSLLEVIACP
jgi:uroporphyrinogen-III synthase